MVDDLMKISQLSEVSDVTGSEMLPLAINGTNAKVSIEKIRGYVTRQVGSSIAYPFADFVSGNVTVISGTATPESGAVIDIVYLEDKQYFVQRKVVNSHTSYYSTWNDVSAYNDSSHPVKGYMYFCTERNKIYSWDDSYLVGISGGIIDGGRADTNYGGARVVDCGGANVYIS